MGPRALPREMCARWRVPGVLRDQIRQVANRLLSMIRCSGVLAGPMHGGI